MSKIQKMISLDVETNRIANEISLTYRTYGGLSYWIRNQLRSYRNKLEAGDYTQAKLLDQEQIKSHLNLSSGQLLHCLEQKSPEEIKVIIQLLTNSIN